MSDKEGSKISRIVRIPSFLGIIIGFLAAFIQALLNSAGGPEAYGFCVACHTRDLINSIINALTGTSLGVAGISATVAVLTVIGVIIGGYIASSKNKEFRIKKDKPLMYILYLFGGIAVMNFALLLGACPYRAALRFAYGDLVALIGIMSIVGGVGIAVIILLQWYKRRGI
ncbi:MAG: YeeE/YedE thiosulfate transporter family protein [Promethearchaeota archaeon]